MESARVAGRFRRLLLPVLVGVLIAVPTMALADHLFGDVSDSSTHADGIHYVVEAGITSGCTPGDYCPGDGLTRGQMATFLHRASGNAPDVAASVNAASVAADAVTTVSSFNVVADAHTNTVTATCPQGTVVIGGGHSNSTQWRLETSQPLGQDRWVVFYRSPDGPASQLATAYARCLRVGA